MPRTAPKTITIRPSLEDKRMVIALRKRLKTTTTGVFRQGLQALAEQQKVRV